MNKKWKLEVIIHDVPVKDEPSYSRKELRAEIYRSLRDLSAGLKIRHMKLEEIKNDKRTIAAK